MCVSDQREAACILLVGWLRIVMIVIKFNMHICVLIVYIKYIIKYIKLANSECIIGSTELVVQSWYYRVGTTELVLQS